jgi:hypothetical protein
MLRRRIKHWWQEHQNIRHLKRGVKEIDKKYIPIFDAAGEDEDSVVDNYIDEVSEYQTRLNFIRTLKLLRKANKLGIEVPDKQTDWFTDAYNVQADATYKVLTELGEARVRNLIRKQRREDMEWWIKVIGALTGLIGVLIGLVAILK